MAKTSTIGSYTNEKKKNQEIPELFKQYLNGILCLNEKLPRCKAQKNL